MKNKNFFTLDYVLLGIFLTIGLVSLFNLFNLLLALIF